MKERLRLLKESIWRLPVLYSIGSITLAIAVYFLDRSQVLTKVTKLLLIDQSLTITILGIIVAAFITIVTFTFSTTMVVLSMYMTQLSPRVVENFLKNETTMGSFAIYLGGFIYGIVSLLLLNDLEGDVYLFSGTLAVLYMILGLIQFIRFVNNVGTYIQTSHVIERLFREAKEKVDDYKDLTQKFELRQVPQDNHGKAFMTLHALSSGYVRYVNHEDLSRYAKDHQLLLTVSPVPGDFIYENEALMTLQGDQLSKIEEEDLRVLMPLGFKKTEYQDIGYTLQKIVEVAVKALSPGINDPNTAVHCIHILASILQDMISLPEGYYCRGEGEGMYCFKSLSLQTLLKDNFNQIHHYGKDDPLVKKALKRAFDVLENQAYGPVKESIGQSKSIILGEV